MQGSGPRIHGHNERLSTWARGLRSGRGFLWEMKGWSGREPVPAAGERFSSSSRTQQGSAQLPNQRGPHAESWGPTFPPSCPPSLPRLSLTHSPISKPRRSAQTQSHIYPHSILSPWGFSLIFFFFKVNLNFFLQPQPALLQFGESFSSWVSMCCPLWKNSPVS